MVFFDTKEVLEAILESIDEGIHVVDLEGKTIFYNKIAANRDGMKVKEVLGKPLLHVFPSLSRQTSTLLEVIRTGKPVFQKEQVYTNIHGKKIETVNTTLPIHVQGRLIGAVEVAKDYSSLKRLSERLLDLESRAQKRTKARASNGTAFQFEDILTANDRMKQLIRQGKRAAQSSSSILVYGESGSGKELFVQSIHNASRRRDHPFIAQNCAALPDSLLESLLFGTAKGSYTGAVERAGLFELANGGTLFLDELQSMPMDLQAKLLRVLEDGMVRRIGATSSRFVDVRIMTAMNIEPNTALKEERLRPDLYYRLNVLSYEIPPLRDRKEDIQLLAGHFIRSFNQELMKEVNGMEPEVSQVLRSHAWPGNVRELKHAIEYMMNHTEEQRLTCDDLPPSFESLLNRKTEKRPLRQALKEVETELINEALDLSAGNVLQASRRLGIPRQTLQYKLQKMNEE
ncbi:sigma-54 interaction domain-containing protein [Bacillus massiliglaciei]|uniref:sigma-54 interaction domain-containing protein n=1 Tax=Bacillus massiliglaciei TaxID=1816693 RepID=UPI000A6607A7|nr:sigma 54-interacting transcriptional regulator [Bacillus massiliglaciei]